MNCLKCGAEMNDSDAICASCGTNNLKLRFYQEGETSYQSEQELLDAVNRGEVKISFQRADKVHIAALDNKWWSIYGLLVATVLSVVVIAGCIFAHNYWGLIAIPILFVICPFTRRRVGILFLIGLIVAIIVKASLGIIIALGCCFIARLMYHYWMRKCDIAAQRVILQYLDDFYIYWYNHKVALITTKDNEVHMHSFLKD